MPTLKNTELLTTVQQLLADHPAGLSEYALIQLLKQQQHPLFINANLGDPLSLFRTHFIVFHALYLIRDTLRHAGSYDLYIDPLRIRLTAVTAAPTTQRQALDRSDSLRDYYLDLKHLASTDRAAVEELLYGSLTRITQPQSVTDALTELGIEQPLQTLNADTLRKHYRQLVSRHHPDRGGCTERLQRINQAMDTLRQHHLVR